MVGFRDSGASWRCGWPTGELIVSSYGLKGARVPAYSSGGAMIIPLGLPTGSVADERVTDDESGEKDMSGMVATDMNYRSSELLSLPSLWHNHHPVLFLFLACASGLISFCLLWHATGIVWAVHWKGLTFKRPWRHRCWAKPRVQGASQWSDRRTQHCGARAWTAVMTPSSGSDGQIKREEWNMLTVESPKWTWSPGSRSACASRTSRSERPNRNWLDAKGTDVLAPRYRRSVWLAVIQVRRPDRRRSTVVYSVP